MHPASLCVPIKYRFVESIGSYIYGALKLFADVIQKSIVHFDLTWLAGILAINLSLSFYRTLINSVQ